MLQTRLGGIASRMHGLNARLLLRTQDRVLGSRAYTTSRPCASTASNRNRVWAEKSRVPTRMGTRIACSTAPGPSTLIAHRSLGKLFAAPIINGSILRSAFPKKTVLFLVILGVAALFLIEVEVDEWPEYFGVRPGYFGVEENHKAWLHFYDDRKSVDDVIRLRLSEAQPTTPRDPEYFMYSYALTDWAMEGDLAQEFDIPVTHGARLKSNPYCEDFYAIGTAPGTGSNPWNYWSIFDGHSGRNMAEALQFMLHPFVSHALSNLSSESTSSVIHETIKEAFREFDYMHLNRAKMAGNWLPPGNPYVLQMLSQVFSGSCALFSAFDPEQSKLRVACVGDSRAVLGRWDPLEKKYVAQPLSVDQTGFNESEVARIKEAHPGEDDILDPVTGRLMGLPVTRAFGDHRWKWDNDFVKELQFKFWGSAPRPQSKTPPYLTAEPEITETDVVRADPRDKSTKSDFMIMANDGLWDRFSSEHAVECVERWLEAKERGNGQVSKDPELKPFAIDTVGAEPGVEYDVESGRAVNWQAEPQYFAIEDDNAAACLLRNALGGNRRRLFFGLVHFVDPLQRSIYDDTTVMVVFFDRNSSDDGKKKNKNKKESSWWPWTSVWDAELSGDARRR